MRPIPQAVRPMEQPDVSRLRCPQCGESGFVRGMAQNDPERGGFSWLFDCGKYACDRTFAISASPGRRA